jgi:hypothetical protein
VDIGDDITRRELLRGAAAAAVVAALPLTRGTQPALAAEPPLLDATLQAVFDTLIPGRKVAQTVSGQAIHPRAILGLDTLPGAVEADALVLCHHPKIGFDALSPVFLAELEARALLHGGDFLSLGQAGREAVLIAGTAYDNPVRLVWEAAAAVAFAAFCGVASVQQDRAHAPGYAVMGLPGAAPAGYRNASYRRRLSRERTKHGYLP